MTDHVMPFMDGHAITGVLRKIRPDIRIILTSGSEKEVEGVLGGYDIDGFLPKPFTTEKLLTIIHEVLVRK